MQSYTHCFSSWYQQPCLSQLCVVAGGSDLTHDSNHVFSVYKKVSNYCQYLLRIHRTRQKTHWLTCEQTEVPLLSVGTGVSLHLYGKIKIRMAIKQKKIILQINFVVERKMVEIGEGIFSVQEQVKPFLLIINLGSLIRDLCDSEP